VNDEVLRIWKKRAWTNVSYHACMCQEELRKTTKNSGYPVYRLRFEPGTFLVQSRSGNHSNTTFGG
jgi:hypothetical protein